LSFYFSLTKIYQGNIDATLTVANFILHSNNWNIDKLKSLFPDDVVQLIVAINIPLIDTTNTFVWGPSPNDRFSIKYATIIQVNTPINVVY
jgi:hypothetical protein